MYMKLVIAIIQDEDSITIMNLLSKKGFFVTKLSSSGGFLRLGNTTLLCGVEDDKVKEVISIIEEEGKSRTQLAPISPGFFKPMQAPVEVTVGGATVFVLDVEDFIKV